MDELPDIALLELMEERAMCKALQDRIDARNAQKHSINHCKHYFQKRANDSVVKEGSPQSKTALDSNA